MPQLIPLDYNVLSTMLQTYLQRNDALFIANIPNFFIVTENTLASKIKNLGQQNFVTTLGMAQLIDKPVGYRQTRSIRVFNSTTNAQYYPISREYEFCRMYDNEVTPQPLSQYYADYNVNQWYFTDYNVATASNVFIEVSYYAAGATLSSTNPTNYWTNYFPQAMWYGILSQALSYLADDERMQGALQLFNAEIDGANVEDKESFNNQALERKVPKQGM